jgi:hypothetical protein
MCQLGCTSNKCSQEWAKTTFADGVDPESEQYWSKFFPGQPYKLTTVNLDEGVSDIACPCCQSQIRSSWADYGKMRTDKRSSLHCNNCKASVTVEALSCARFAKDWLETTTSSIKLAYVFDLFCSVDTEIVSCANFELPVGSNWMKRERNCFCSQRLRKG